MVFGGLMVVLGAVAYVATNFASMTALIPSFFGLGLIVLGLVARQGDRARMHAMHGAALLGLLGLVGGIVMLLRIDPAQRPEAFWENVGFAGLSAVFLALCVKSFIDARRARKQREAANP